MVSTCFLLSQVLGALRSVLRFITLSLQYFEKKYIITYTKFKNITEKNTARLTFEHRNSLKSNTLFKNWSTYKEIIV